MVVVASAENGGLLHLVGDTLMIHKKDGTTASNQDQYLVPSSNALKGVKLACFYFSASWCKPCQVFTPVLRQFYNEVCLSNHVAIIFVSSDKDPQSFQQYYKQMPWFCIPPDQPTLRRGLALHFGIQGIPTLVVIDPSTGNVITTEGRMHVGQTVVTKGSSKKDATDDGDDNRNNGADEYKESSYSKKAQAVIDKWKSMEPIPVEEAIRNNASFNKPSNNNPTGLIQYLLKNPAFVFILIFIVRQSMSFVTKHASLYLNQQRQHSSSSSTITVPLPPQQLSSSRPFVKILPSNNNNNNNDKHEEDEF